MGTITVNVEDQMEIAFRKAVLSEKGKGKGKLGQAVTEAFELWILDKRDKEIAKYQLNLLNKGLYKSNYKFHRADAYER